MPRIYETFRVLSFIPYHRLTCWELGFLYSHYISHHCSCFPLCKSLLVLVCHCLNALFFLPLWIYAFLITCLFTLYGISGEIIKVVICLKFQASIFKFRKKVSPVVVSNVSSDSHPFWRDYLNFKRNLLWHIKENSRNMGRRMP